MKPADPRNLVKRIGRAGQIRRSWERDGAPNGRSPRDDIDTKPIGISQRGQDGGREGGQAFFPVPPWPPAAWHLFATRCARSSGSRCEQPARRRAAGREHACTRSPECVFVDASTVSQPSDRAAPYRESRNEPAGSKRPTAIRPVARIARRAANLSRTGESFRPTKISGKKRKNKRAPRNTRSCNYTGGYTFLRGSRSSYCRFFDRELAEIGTRPDRLWRFTFVPRVVRARHHSLRLFSKPDVYDDAQRARQSAARTHARRFVT